MKDKKFLDKIAEETIVSPDKEKVILRIKDTLRDTPSPKRIKAGTLYIITAVIAVILLAALTVTLMMLLKPEQETGPIQNTPELDNPVVTPPPFFGHDDWITTYITEEELKDYVDIPVIEGFILSTISLNSLEEDGVRIPVYLNLQYTREIMTETPSDGDIIYFKIKLKNDFMLIDDTLCSDTLLPTIFTVNVKGEEQTIRYYEQSDAETALAEARTKITYCGKTSFIETTYFEPFEEGNRLQWVVEDILNSET